ncbi:MAG: hypothetical protein EOP04_00175 [Proteobacteria bacterium]|nr:MAG: hypothetical protein EOP04_00175 [Pseudomonadota bacterium]
MNFFRQIFMFLMMTTGPWACRSELAVFLPTGIFPSKFEGLKTVTVDPEGNFLLAWDLPSSKNSRIPEFEVFLSKQRSVQASLNLDSETRFISTTFLEAGTDIDPFQSGTKIATVAGLDNFVFQNETIDPESYYVFQVKLKGSRNSQSALPIVAKVNFKPDPSINFAFTSATTEISWPAIEGATSYLIFKDANDPSAAFETNTNSISLSLLEASQDKSYCLRAARGKLRSKECLPLTQIGSNWKPFVTGFNAPAPSGYFKTGDQIQLELYFSDSIILKPATNVFLPLVFSDGSTHFATYQRGSGSDSFVFQYSLQDGDNSGALVLGSDLQVSSTDGLQDLLGRSLKPSLSDLELKLKKSYVLDTTPPQDPVSVGFASAVTRGTSASFSWSGGTDVNFASFEAKLCESGDCLDSCKSSITTMQTSANFLVDDGTSYFGCVKAKDKVGYESSWVASLQTILVDRTVPSVMSVSTPKANGIYTTGTIVPIRVEFNEAIRVVTAEDILLKIRLGTAGRFLNYSSGSGTNTLVFNYEVENGDTSNALDIYSTGSLSLGGSAAILDFAENPASNLLPGPGTAGAIYPAKSISIDTTPPTSPIPMAFASSMANSLTVPLSWSASTDAHLVRYRAKLCSDSACSADCVGESTNTGTSLSLTGVTAHTYYGCVRAEDGALLNSAWTATSNTLGIDIDAPTIVSLTSTLANGVYTTGTVIPITVNFSEAVTVTNGTALTLDLTLTGKHASYVSGGGGTALLFNYTVQAGDNRNSLELPDAAALSLNSSATLRDSAGNNAVLTIPFGGAAGSLTASSNIDIDTTLPTTAASVSVTSSTSFPTNYGVSWTAGVDAHMKHYNVKLCPASDCSTSCLSPLPFTSSPATLIGSAGQSYFGCVQSEDKIGLQSSWVVSSGLVVTDNTPPTMLSVSSSKADGFYPAGTIIPVTVVFSEPVFTSSLTSITLELTSNASHTLVPMSGGDGTDTLVFSYTVVAGDVSSDLNYAATNSLVLGAGATIRDAAGNDAVIALPATGSANSLATQKNLVIDTIVPTAPSSVGFSGATSTSASFTVNFSASSDTNFRQHNVKLCSASDCTTSCLAVQSSATSPFTFSSIADGSYYACIQGEDKAGLKSAWVPGINPITVDATAPTVTKVTSTTVNGYYKAGTVIPIRVEFSENLVITSATSLSLKLETGTVDQSAAYASASANVILFNYTVQPGDTSIRLDVFDVNSLTLGGAALSDAAGNVAVLALPLGSDSSSIKTLKSLVIDTTAPVPAISSPSPATQARSSIPLVATCETNSTLSISGDVSPALSNLSCASGTVSRTIYFTAAEGSKAVNVIETDRAGNTGTASRSFINDTIAPALTQTSALPTTYSGGSTITLGGSCETSLDVYVKLGGVTEGQIPCNRGSWSYTTATQTTDGNRVYTVAQTDAAGNVASVSLTWIRDSVAPSFTFDDLSSSYSAVAISNSYTFIGNCDSSASVASLSINISGSGIAGSTNVSCSLGTWTYTTPTVTVDATYNYIFVQTDRSGNATTLTGSWTRSATGPVFTATSILIKSAANNATFAGVCNSSFTIAVSGPGSPSTPSCTSGAWTFTTPTASTDGNKVYTLMQTNTLNVSTTLTLTFLRDTGAPAVSGMQINGGDTTTNAYRVNAQFTATDAHSPIASICILKKSWANTSTSPTAPTRPVSTDDCWQSLISLGLATGKTVNISNFAFTLDLASAKYSAYIFVKDEVGNISTSTNSDGVDRGTITLDFPTPPTISIVAVTDAAEADQKEFTAGDELDIHWKISGGSNIGSNPVSIRWSINDSTWSTLASNLSDSTHNCATVTAATGCLRLTVPTSQYFRLQLVITNTVQNSFFIESSPLNTGGKIRVVAGRTFNGIDGTARGYYLKYPNMDSLRGTSPSQFAVTREGTIYVIDQSLGVLKVDPKDQIVKNVFPRGSFSGDGAIVSGMAFNNPSRIWLDKTKPMQRIFVADDSALRVIDLNANTVKSYATTSDTSIVVGTTANVFVTNQGIFTLTGATSGGKLRLRPAYLDEASGNFIFLSMTNTSALPNYSSTSNQDCELFTQAAFPVLSTSGAFNRWFGPATLATPSEFQWNCRGNNIWDFNFSTLTATYIKQQGSGITPAVFPSTFVSNIDTVSLIGLDGRIYSFLRMTATSDTPGGIIRYGPSGNSWSKVLGLNSSLSADQISCPDSTLAGSCDVDVSAAFVDENGMIYFLEQGRIRLIDSQGKIQTIFGTTSKNLGSNLSASETVLGSSLHYFQRRIQTNDSEEVVFSHYPTATYRSVIDGILNVLAGNGVNLTTGGKTSSVGGFSSGPATGPAPGVRDGWTLESNNPFGMDESGNLYAGDYGNNTGSQDNIIFKLTRSSLNWSTFIPYTCTGCAAMASDAFDATKTTSYSPSTPLQLYNARLGVPSSTTSLGTRINQKPLVLGYENGRITVYNQDAPFTYTGTTSGGLVNNVRYLLNSQVASMDISTFNGKSVTDSTRIIGTKGTALLTANPDQTDGAPMGEYSALPPSGTAANSFDIEARPWGSTSPAAIRMQTYDGSSYMVTRHYAKNLLKIGTNVTTSVLTDNNMASMRLIKSGSDDMLYYCSSTGTLYKRNLSNPTSPAETVIDLIIPGAACSGATLLHYIEDGNEYLMTAYTQNSLSGILELKLSN